MKSFLCSLCVMAFVGMAMISLSGCEPVDDQRQPTTTQPRDSSPGTGTGTGTGTGSTTEDDLYRLPGETP